MTDYSTMCNCDYCRKKQKAHLDWVSSVRTAPLTTVQYESASNDHSKDTTIKSGVDATETLKNDCDSL